MRLTALLCLIVAPALSAQSPARPVRTDIPMTRAIQRAFAAGTRDSTGRPGRNYWQLWMDYKIDTRLDPATSTVSGRESVVIHNNSDSAMSSVVLRLDQNLFTPKVPRAEPVADITGGMKLTRLVINGETIDIADSVGKVRPGSNRRSGPMSELLAQTSARIPLANPIPAKGTGTLETEWSFRVPHDGPGVRGDRMGTWGDSLYEVAQWYPRVAVYDDLRGWDTEPYLNTSEFYNNFGHFDVRIDVPAGWIVGATGVLQNPLEVLTPAARERLARALETDSVQHVVTASEQGPGRSTANGTRLVWHFVADTVGDFAWGTSNQFVWDAVRANVAGKGIVPVNILYLPGHTSNYATAPAIATHALEYYSRLWMPYAFPQLTVVDGPENGMEYPMFIMSSAGAADHETGHQWWPMTLGTNETWYPFMDEGFNQYMNILSRADRTHTAVNLDGAGQSYGARSGDESEAPLMWNANYGGPGYSFQGYGKAPLMLSMLGGIVGNDTIVWEAMSAYAKAWRFKHPSPWDFAFFMQREVEEPDLGWFWYYWLFTNESVDGSIQSVTTKGDTTLVVIRQDGQMPSPIDLKVELAPDDSFPIDWSTVAVKVPGLKRSFGDRRSTTLTYDVNVWFGGNRTFTVPLLLGAHKGVKLTLDPGRRYPDKNPADNVWPRK